MPAPSTADDDAALPRGSRRHRPPPRTPRDKEMVAASGSRRPVRASSSPTSTGSAVIRTTAATAQPRSAHPQPGSSAGSLPLSSRSEKSGCNPDPPASPPPLIPIWIAAGHRHLAFSSSSRSGSSQRVSLPLPRRRGIAARRWVQGAGLRHHSGSAARLPAPSAGVGRGGVPPPPCPTSAARRWVLIPTCFSKKQGAGG